MKKILVIGASGMLGAPVARALRAHRFQVRLLARNPERMQDLHGPGFEIVPGDVGDEASLERALDGCDGVHVNLMGGPRAEDFDRIEHHGTARVARVAQRLGLARLTYLSGAPVCAENLLDPGTRAKYEAEEAIRHTGIPHTIFRATWMMEALPLFIRGSRALLPGRQPHPVRWVAADDYAAMVARAFVTPETINRNLYVFGPEALTKGEALRIYTSSVCPEVKVTPVPLWLMSVLATLSFDAGLRSDVRRMRFYETIGDDFGDAGIANRLLGAPQTTLNAWCEARRAAAT